MPDADTIFTFLTQVFLGPIWTVGTLIGAFFVLLFVFLKFKEWVSQWIP